MRIFILTVLLLPVQAPANNGFGIPKIFYSYASVYDDECEKIDSDVQTKIPKSELKSRIREETFGIVGPLQKQWDSEGNELLRAVFKVVGRGMERKELTAYVAGCNYYSMGSPFMIGVRRYLKSVRKEPSPITNLLETTLHEFLHIYLFSTFDYSRSKILLQYKKETKIFQYHLHLMALLEAALQRAKRKDLVERARLLYTVYTKGDYGKAWELGTSKELQDELIDEIRTLKGSRKKLEIL